jgi:hypothetical protein
MVTPIRTRVAAAALLRNYTDDWHLAIVPADKLCEVVVLGIDNAGEGDPPAEHAVAKCLVFVGDDTDWLIAELPLEFVKGLVPLGDLALHAPDDLAELDETEPTFESIFDFKPKTQPTFFFKRSKAGPGLFTAAMLCVEGEGLIAQWKRRRPLKRTAAWLKQVKANFTECEAAVENALELLSDVAVIRDPAAWQRTELLEELTRLVEFLRPKFE